MNTAVTSEDRPAAGEHYQPERQLRQGSTEMFRLKAGIGPGATLANGGDDDEDEDEDEAEDEGENEDKDNFPFNQLDADDDDDDDDDEDSELAELERIDEEPGAPCRHCPGWTDGGLQRTQREAEELLQSLGLRRALSQYEIWLPTEIPRFRRNLPPPGTNLPGPPPTRVEIRQAVHEVASQIARLTDGQTVRPLPRNHLLLRLGDSTPSRILCRAGTAANPVDLVGDGTSANPIDLDDDDEADDAGTAAHPIALGDEDEDEGGTRTVTHIIDLGDEDEDVAGTAANPVDLDDDDEEVKEEDDDDDDTKPDDGKDGGGAAGGTGTGATQAPKDGDSASRRAKSNTVGTKKKRPAAENTGPEPKRLKKNARVSVSDSHRNDKRRPKQSAARLRKDDKLGFLDVYNQRAKGNLIIRSLKPIDEELIERKIENTSCLTEGVATESQQNPSDRTGVRARTHFQHLNQKGQSKTASAKPRAATGSWGIDRTDGPDTVLITHPMHPGNREFYARLDEIERRKIARLRSESVYGDYPPRLPRYGPSEEPHIAFGLEMPHLYARVPTLSEIKALRRRLDAAENEILQREQSCRLCFEPFRTGATDMRAHYDKHRSATTPLCPFCGEDWSSYNYKEKAAHVINVDFAGINLAPQTRTDAGNARSTDAKRRVSRKAAAYKVAIEPAGLHVEKGDGPDPPVADVKLSSGYTLRKRKQPDNGNQQTVSPKKVQSSQDNLSEERSKRSPKGRGSRSRSRSQNAARDTSGMQKRARASSRAPPQASSSPDTPKGRAEDKPGPTNDSQETVDLTKPKKRKLRKNDDATYKDGNEGDSETPSPFLPRPIKRKSSDHLDAAFKPEDTQTLEPDSPPKGRGRRRNGSGKAEGTQKTESPRKPNASLPSDEQAEAEALGDTGLLRQNSDHMSSSLSVKKNPESHGTVRFAVDEPVADAYQPSVDTPSLSVGRPEERRVMPLDVPQPPPPGRRGSQGRAREEMPKMAQLGVPTGRQQRSLAPSPEVKI